MASSTSSPDTDVDTGVPVPAGLSDRVAQRVRRTLHVPDGYVSLDAHEQGQLQVSRSVVVDIARQAAATIPGVLAVSASLSGRSFQVDLVLDYGMNAVEVANRARAQARRMVRECVGLRLADVDVHVVDVVVPTQDEVAPAGGPEK